eukprot:SAG11_NODE_22714_length_401_cov_1.026490_1_plen_26_part_10
MSDSAGSPAAAECSGNLQKRVGIRAK